MHISRDRFCAVLSCCLIAQSCALFLPGCGGERSDSEFIPSSEKSLASLKTALETWKAGKTTAPIAGTSPLIHVTDSSRIPGQTLDAFEILGEVPGNAPRCFAVKLRLSNPVEEKRERYVVVGIDPLLIFRHEDYDMLLHWEHPMEPEPKSPTLGSNAEDLSPEASKNSRADGTVKP